MSGRTIPGWLAVPAAGLLLGLRMPDRFLHPQFFAEDAYFYECALAKGARSLVMPYGGYLLTIQRLAAWFATALPPLFVPGFFNAVALGTDRSPSPPGSFSPASLSRTVSAAGPRHRPPPRVEDIFLVFENLQWVMALGLVLLLVSSDARTAGQRLGDGLIAALFGLTGVFSILLLPLFLFRALQRKSRDSWILAAVIGAAALIQIVALLHAPAYRPAGPVAFEPALVPTIFGVRVWEHLFGGNGLLGLSPFTFSLVGALGFIYLVRICARSDLPALERSHRRTFLAVIVLISAASLYRFKDMLGMFLSPEHLERYFFVPEVLCLWLIVTDFSASPLRRGLAIALFPRFSRPAPVSSAWSPWWTTIGGTPPPWCGGTGP